MTTTYEWTAHHDDAGELYYYNDKTGESSWDQPANNGFNPVVIVVVAAPQNNKWTKHTNDEGQDYYFNQETDETQWDTPDDYVEEEEEEEAASKDIDMLDAVDVEQQPSTAVMEETSQQQEEDPAAATNGKEPQEAPKVDSMHVEPSTNNDNNEEQEASSDEKPEVVEPETEHVEPTKKEWTKHTDDEGRAYYFDEESGETQWDKPDEFVEDEAKADDDDKSEASTDFNKQQHDSDDDAKSDASTDFNKFTNDDEDDLNEASGESPVQPSSPFDAATPEHDGPPGDDDDDEEKKWIKHTDDEGREYYYNEKTQETQWDKPSGFVEDVVAKGKWSKHADDEGREYFYNETTGETSWEKPTDYEEPTEGEPSKTEEKKEEEDVKEEEEGEQVEEGEQIEEPQEPEPEPEIDPALKRLQDAENALNQPDAIMEPGCLDNVRELISGGGNEGGSKAMQSLLSSFHGETAICGVLGLWLADLKSAEEEPTKAAKAADHVRDTAQEVITKIAKDRFTKAGGDNIFQLKKSEAVFLEDMMDSSLWRKLLIDLSATHRDSTLLSYCLSSISKRGHHREIAKRINQSDHFQVYSAMLASEFTIVGNGGEAMGMHDLLEDLRRTCTSTSYTYLYAIELLRHLVHTAEERASSDPSLNQAIRKWTRLREELENAMVDPAVSAKTAGSSSLYRKRRRDVALTISELTQRQRRRLRPGVDENGNLQDEHRDSLELALSNLLLRHAESKKFDDQMLDQLLSHGSNPKQLGRLVNAHPLAIKALLGHLFLPGSLRVGSLTTRSKCARLVALAVLAAEAATKTERGFEDPAARQAKEEEIKGNLLTGSQMCELVENMVSFKVSSGTEVKESNPSAGVKLSVLANRVAPVAEGVVMWAKVLVSGNEFVSSASYPTLAPSILSLLRIISTRHPFTRPSVSDVALMFLGHTNSELTYQKMNEIKEQALRVLLFLLVQGEVCSVLGDVANLLENSGSSDLDSSLARYFVGGLLDIIAPPCSPLMVTALGNLLMTPRCVDALNSAYFPDEKKAKLKTLLGMIRLALPKGKDETSNMVEALTKTYG